MSTSDVVVTVIVSAGTTVATMWIRAQVSDWLYYRRLRDVHKRVAELWPHTIKAMLGRDDDK